MGGSRGARCVGPSRRTSRPYPGRDPAWSSPSTRAGPRIRDPGRSSRSDPENSPTRLLKLARAADYTVLIAPETTGILAGLTRDLERAGARLLGSSAEAVELAGDKARLADCVRDARDCHSANPDDRPRGGASRRVLEYPAVLKPSTEPARSIPSTSPIGTSVPDACASHAHWLASAVRRGDPDECQLPRRGSLGRAPHRHRPAEDGDRGG